MSLTIGMLIGSLIAWAFFKTPFGIAVHEWLIHAIANPRNHKSLDDTCRDVERRFGL